MLSATVYVRDKKDFAAMNAVWDAWVPEGHAPARACVEARMARAELLMEIFVVAAVKLNVGRFNASDTVYRR